MRADFLPILLLLACSGKGDDGDDTGAADADADTDADTDSVRGAVFGTITWGVDFDSDAEAAGATDCAYTRQYTGSTDLSAPWLCPSCELLFRADVEMLDDWEDCYAQVSSTDPTPEEWLGYADGLWYRASTSALSERGPSEFDGETWTVSQEVESAAPVGGGLVFEIEGTLTVGEEAGDPLHGWGAADTYACGWPKADPPAYDGDYTADLGDVLPDGLFPDACEDPVRLHDLAGRYLIVEISAMDCGPCRSAAAAEAGFIEEMAAEGIEVEVVTLLAPSLSDTAGTPETEDLVSWTDTYGIHSPVLGDRVWGLSVAAAAVGDDFGYPTFIVADPDLIVIDLQVGFSSYDDFAALIREDAAR